MSYFTRPPDKLPVSKYSEICKTAAVSPDSGKNLVFRGATLHNREGNDNNLGMGWKFTDGLWKAGQIDDSATPDYIDDTTDAQDAGADDFALFTTTNNDGFAIQSGKKFNLIGITISTAEIGAPTYEYTYWNGSAWTAVTLIDTPDYTGAGDTYLSFETPIDWAVSDGTAVTTNGMTSGQYAFRARATTAPGTAPLATLMWVVQIFDWKEANADNSILNFDPFSDIGTEGFGGSSLIPYFGTASANNMVSVSYSQKG
ncbi:MAG: hypothetical protein GY861_08360 [bacterium]|nr:hypothetical protein [bacterium]